MLKLLYSKLSDFPEAQTTQLMLRLNICFLFAFALVLREESSAKVFPVLRVSGSETKLRVFLATVDKEKKVLVDGAQCLSLVRRNLELMLPLA